MATQVHAVQRNRKTRGPSFRGASFYDKDFSGQDLSGADFRGATLHGCKFDNCDLAYADFEGADCDGSSFIQARLYRTNFKDACLRATLMDPRDIFGTTVTIHCNTVARTKMSKLWVAAWLMMLLPADIPTEQKDAIKSVVDSLIGPERAKAVQRAFEGRDI